MPPSAIELILLDPSYQPLLAIIKGFRNGLVYGWKVRFPHSLVMTFLFKKGSLKHKLRFVFSASVQHAKNLASFVTIYKSALLALRWLGKGEAGWHAALAGFVGGRIVFGESNNINLQIVLYLFSRVSIGSAKLLYSHLRNREGLRLSSRCRIAENDPLPSSPVLNEPKLFPYFAALTWAAVMYLFRHHRHVLQPSLQSSMQYLYLDSERWSGLRDWIWVNE